MTYRYGTFVFEGYDFNAQSKTLALKYRYEDGPRFIEEYLFDFDFVDYNQQMLDSALKILHFVAGISYFKTFLAENIITTENTVDERLSEFLQTTYQKGLGEFFYVNNLDPRLEFDFKINKSLQQVSTSSNEGLLVGLGGGKDSLVSVEALKNSGLKFATWSVGHKKQLLPLVNVIGEKHFWVERRIDNQLTSLNSTGAYNGHVPISAIFAAVGTVVAVLSGYKDVVVSNESSADEPTLTYQGVNINHQYSKSSDFELDYQQLLKTRFGESINYYSLLRPFSELYISEIFCKRAFDKYHTTFSSCNSAFKQDSDHIFWDGTCPKCAFIFLAFTPFLEKKMLIELFDGENLLTKPDLAETYKDLLGITGTKPLECVGEIKESRSAMEMAKKIYPDLNKYAYEIPADYDYKRVGASHSPPEIFKAIENYFT